MQEHLAQLEQLRRRTLQRVGRTLDRETQYVLRLRTAIDRAHPARLIDTWLEDVQQHRSELRRNTIVELDRRRASLHTAVAQLRALSPQATLERGFAVVRTIDGVVVTDPAQLTPANVDIRVARGTFTATPILESTNG